MSIFQTMKLANSLDFEKLGAAIPGFILRKIREKFTAIKNVIQEKLQEGEKRPALLLYEDDHGNFTGLWVTLDASGQVKRKIMIQDIQGLAKIDDGQSLFALIPEIMAEAGQKVPDFAPAEQPQQNMLFTEPKPQLGAAPEDVNQ